MSKEKIEVITYKQDRLYFFVDQVSLAQKKYDRLFKTFKDAPYLSEGAQFLSDAGRELQFYKDIVEMLDKGYRKASEVAREIEKIEQQVGKIYNRYVFEDTDYADDDVAIEAVINALTDVLNDLADFKKKYTEGENGTK